MAMANLLNNIAEPLEKLSDEDLISLASDIRDSLYNLLLRASSNDKLSKAMREREVLAVAYARDLLGELANRLENIVVDFE